MSPVPRRFGFHSVRTRLMLWNMGIVALVLAAMGGLISVTVRGKLMGAVERDLHERANRVGLPRPVEDPEGGLDGGPDRFEGIRLGPPRFAREPDGSLSQQAPRVFDPDGRGRPPFQDLPPYDEEAFTLSARGQEIVKTIFIDEVPVRLLSTPRFTHPGPPPRYRPGPGPENRGDEPPRFEPHLIGVIQAAYPLTEVNRSIEEMDRTLLMLIPVALVLAGLGGAWLTDRALRPVRRITQTAARIGADDLRERLPLTGGDEFAELSGTINGMLERLQASFGHMAALVEQQRRFTADASHELKTPLTIIKANSSLTLATRPDAAGYQEAVEEIDRAANSMIRLVQDLLLLARADEARAGQDRTSIPVAEFLREIAARARRPGYARIECESASESATVRANREELARVLTNLVENSLRHTPEEGTITLACRPGSGGISLSVTDTGDGISAEHLPHLFERFYRVDTSRARVEGGTGLGLAICKSLVEANGGWLQVSSQEGRGTSVTITLPNS